MSAQGLGTAGGLVPAQCHGEGMGSREQAAREAGMDGLLHPHGMLSGEAAPNWHPGDVKSRVEVWNAKGLSAVPDGRLSD